ncbi:hypothetical protein [Chryseobacterium sp.]|uniref:hypothetical protein n=1 Tax=Chryseobacterium sp. TaxID=1871047 RepID=UPI00289B62E8|nr:hypothetical protein [Chryseobacterium sp.]
MEGKFFKIIFFLSFVVFYSCQNSKTQDIDSVISKYDDTDFSVFKGAFIAIRQRNSSETTYMLGDSEGNNPLYFIEYDEMTNKIILINNSILKKAKIPDYFSNEEIEKLITYFRKYDFVLLSVDKDNNVFINPFEINSPALLIRFNKLPNTEKIKKGYAYKQYTGNWYLKE